MCKKWSSGWTLPILFFAFFQMTLVLLGQGDIDSKSKSLTELIGELESSDPKTQEHALNEIPQQIRGFGGDLFDFYLDRGKSAAYDSFLKEAIPLTSRLLTLLRSEDENIAYTSSTIMNALRTEANSVASELEKLILNTEMPISNRMFALQVLLAVTPEDEPVGEIFIKFLDSLPKETLWAMDTAWEKGLDLDTEELTPEARQKIKLEAERMRSTSVGLSIVPVVLALTSTGHTKVEVPTLVKIASGDYPTTIRAVAIGVLEEFAFDARAAIPALEELLSDEEKFIRMNAASALLGIQGDRLMIPEVVKKLELTDDERQKFEKGCQEYFNYQEKERKKLSELYQDGDVDDYIQILKYGNGFHRRLTILALGKIGPNAKSAIPEIRKALDDPDKETRRFAAEALKSIQ